jgi:hypothetical protein
MVQPSIVEKRERELTQIQEEIQMQAEQTVSSRGSSKKLGCLVVAAIALAAAYLLLLIVVTWDVKQSPGRTATAFAESLQTNSLRQAKRLVAGELWLPLEEWISEHEEVDCPLSLESKLFSTPELTSDHRPDRREHRNVYIRTPCPRTSNEWYCLNVHDIVLERRDGGWVIIGWGSVEERLAPGYCDDF